jgi:hypothetical protein
LSRAPAAALLVLLTLAGCGGDDEAGFGRLSWETGPKIYKPETLPHDRILSGMVRNESLRRVDLVAKRLKLLDEDGHRVAGSGIFLAGFGRGLYPPTRQPKLLPKSERLRTGVEARIQPGDSVPLTMSWRLVRGRKPPVRIEYGGGSLPIP